MSEEKGVCAIVPQGQEGFRPKVFGMGILFGDRELLTCAHVVDDALGTDWQKSPGPAFIRVCFPFAHELCVEGTVDTNRWFPVGRTRDGQTSDVAVIRLNKDAPAKVGRADLRKHTSGSKAKAYGIRGEEVSGVWHSHPDGEWAWGMVAGKLPGGRGQFEGLRQTGARVQPGFSGGGVYDPSQEAVIGMVVESDREAKTKIAQFIDVPSLWQALGRAGEPPGPHGRPELTSQVVADSILSLETTALRLADLVPIKEDGKWVATARRLHPLLHFVEGTSRRDVIRHLTSLSDRDEAGEKTTALLLRMAELADQDRTPINQALPDYVNLAQRLNQNVFAERLAYVLGASFDPDNHLQVRNAWFCGGPDGTPPVAIERIPADGLGVDETVDLIQQHMESNHSAAAVIEIAAPLDAILDPPKEVVEELEAFYCLVFRWRQRTEAKGKFRRIRLRMQTLTQVIKARAAAGVKAEWFDATVKHEELFARMEVHSKRPLDFPAVRVGVLANESERLEELERLLYGSAAPFAAITRPSACALAEVDEQKLIECVGAQDVLRRLPTEIRGYRTTPGGEALKHLSIIWDDFDNNPFLYTYS